MSELEHAVLVATCCDDRDGFPHQFDFKFLDERGSASFEDLPQYRYVHRFTVPDLQIDVELVDIQNDVRIGALPSRVCLLHLQAAVEGYVCNKGDVAG